MKTQQEKKQEVDEVMPEADEGAGGPPSVMEGEEVDLDASMWVPATPGSGT